MLGRRRLNLTILSIFDMSASKELEDGRALRQSLCSSVIKVDATFNNVALGTVTLMTGEGLVTWQWHGVRHAGCGIWLLTWLPWTRGSGTLAR